MDAHSSNVFLTLNGHYATDCGYSTSAPINNQNLLMFDRQDCTDNEGDPTGGESTDIDDSRCGQDGRGDRHDPHLRHAK